MFWFHKKKRKVTVDDGSSISFQDMLQQNIKLSVESDGNGSVFEIFSQSKTNTVRFLLDKEQCLLFSEILKDYVTNGNLNKIKSIIVEE